METRGQGQRVTWELSVLPAPFFCKSKIINLKNRLKKKKEADLKVRDERSQGLSLADPKHASFCECSK